MEQTIPATFKKLAFWNLFSFLERAEVKEEMVDQWLDALGQDFKIEREQFDFKVGNQRQEGFNRILVLEFDCGRGYTLRLEYTPHPEGGEKYLYLCAPHQEKQLMGWWNLENWHPYALSPEELDLLLSYWEKQGGKWTNRHLAHALLHDFVGLDSEEATADYAAKTFEAFNELRIKGFAKVEQKPIAIFYYEDSEYHWRYNRKLGWLFESDQYACYSIRNKAHSKGEEGRFPFEDWNYLMKQIRQEVSQ